MVVLATQKGASLMPQIKILPATDTRGTRVRGSFEGYVVTVPYDYALDLQGNKEKAREALEARIAGKKSTKKGRITK